jgi:hypothetical protein
MARLCTARTAVPSGGIVPRRDKARAQQQYCDAPLLRGTVAIRSAMAE